MDVLAVICGLVFLDDRVQVVLDPLYLAVLVQLLDHALEPVSLALLPEIDPVLVHLDHLAHLYVLEAERHLFHLAR